MTAVTVAPGLELTDEMYERTYAALQKYGPDEVEKFTWENFITRENWLLIPDAEHPDNPWYKAEYAIKQRKPYKQVLKLNVWESADLRRDGAPMPHSHPWPFTGHVLMGGYKEDRYTVERRDELLDNPFSPFTVGLASVMQGVVHKAGHDNAIDLVTFHEVTEVLEPRRTLSLMDCGSGRQNGWGYLDPDTGLYTPKKESPLDPRFMALFYDRNPHLK